ncbi:MAG: protease complex subunit PrcB family protein [Treponema sp.]
MNKLILLVLFFHCLSFLTCKSIDSSSKKAETMEMQKLTLAKKNSDVKYDFLSTNYYSSNPYAQGIYIARSFADAIAITEGDSRLEETLSNIDFEKEALIFVFAGTFNTGGYGIKVDSITRTAKNQISAIFSITTPAPSSIVTQAFTNPSIIVSVKVNKADTIQASFK